MTVQKALFRCVKNNKVLYCESSDDPEDHYLIYGSGFPPTDCKDVVNWLDVNGNLVEYPYQEGYFDKFVRTHSRTMKKEL